MNRKWILPALLALLLAFATSFVLHKGNTSGLRYHFKSASSVRKELERTIDQFNKLYASFYVTGGNSDALSAFPAANLVKRRIYQDINQWRDRGQWLIHDLHNEEISRVEVLSPVWAVVETRETWDLWLRDIETGKKTGRRTNAIKVRYHLTRSGDRWGVVEYEVFGPNEDLPPISEDLL